MMCGYKGRSIGERRRSKNSDLQFPVHGSAEVRRNRDGEPSGFELA